jgi:hypothetical protein
MSSRQEEKERRRKEREAIEQAARASAARRKRLGIAAIALAAIVALAVVGLAVGGVLGGGDDDGSGPGEVSGEVAPPPKFDAVNLDEASKAAGCTVSRDRNEGADHTPEPVKYQKNPPTSGDHDPVAAIEGEYDEAPDVEQSVHALEHGRINVQYKPGAPPERVAQLRGLLEEEFKGIEGYKTLLFPNQTGMTPAVAATAWTRSLTCPEWNDRVFDAIRQFREDFVDKGPEFIPPQSG